VDVYGLEQFAAPGSPHSASGGARLKYLLGELNAESYLALLRRAIVADHDPENVILMEIHPHQQKTLPDFLLTEKMLGIRTVDITTIRKEGAGCITSAMASACPSDEFITALLWMNSSVRE